MANQKETDNEALRLQVVRTLLYFDIFRYPLTEEEIYRFLGVEVERPVLTGVLKRLEGQGVLFCSNQFYSINIDEGNVLRRIRGNREAENAMPLAHQWAKLISAFPFVRGVLGSGSLSKGYMDEKSDLDFFIVTAHNRLWIARTILVLYKRLFLSNSHKYFCVNYFVDEKNPVIDEQNIFTATELSTLLPFYGAAEYRQLLQSNEWIHHYFPNFRPKSTEQLSHVSSGATKRILESLFNLAAPRLINRWLRNLSLNRWRRIYERDYSKEDFKLVFKSNQYTSKNHPQNFQKKVLTMHEEKIKAFEHKLFDAETTRAGQPSI